MAEDFSFEAGVETAAGLRERGWKFDASGRHFLLDSHLAPFSITCLGTGKMPVPQENSFFVERASCPFLTMVQHLSFNRLDIFATKPMVWGVSSLHCRIMYLSCVPDYSYLPMISYSFHFYSKLNKKEIESPQWIPPPSPTRLRGLKWFATSKTRLPTQKLSLLST